MLLEKYVLAFPPLLAWIRDNKGVISESNFERCREELKKVKKAEVAYDEGMYDGIEVDILEQLQTKAQFRILPPVQRVQRPGPRGPREAGR